MTDCILRGGGGARGEEKGSRREDGIVDGRYLGCDIRELMLFCVLKIKHFPRECVGGSPSAERGDTGGCWLEGLGVAR